MSRLDRDHRRRCARRSTPTASTTRPRRVYQFLWHEFCDWYLEIAKRSLYQPEDPAARAVTQRTLVETLETTLRLLHPFMPFISEEHLAAAARTQGESIMIAPFPKAGAQGARSRRRSAQMAAGASTS